MSWKKYNEQDCTHLLYEGCVDPADEPLDSDEVEENTHVDKIRYMIESIKEDISTYPGIKWSVAFDFYIRLYKESYNKTRSKVAFERMYKYKRMLKFKKHS